MSQQIINISTPDDGLGDVLRNGFDKTNQNFTELYNGKVDKITGQGLSENNFTDSDKSKLDGIESGAEVNVQADFAETDPSADSFILNKPPALYSAFGYFHVSDLATQTAPLEFVASTPWQLTNDSGGAFTNYAQAPYGVNDIWNTSTNQFEFEKLSVGDGVLFRADLSISTSSVNQNLQLYIKFGIGTPSEYDLLIDSWNEKSVITFKHFLKDVSFSIDNEDWRTAPAKIYILSDDDGMVKVNGWYIPIIRKSVNLIDIYSDPSKLDKSTTPSSVYGTNTAGGQTMIPLSELENVANKTTNLTSPNNIKYPTTLAVVNENKKATITVELINQLTTNFYAPNALRINSTALISGSGTITLKVNDVAYTLGNLITQGQKITVETTTASVYNLISVYE